MNDAELETQVETIREECVRGSCYEAALELLWAAEMHAEGTYMDAIQELQATAIQAAGRWEEYSALMDQLCGCPNCGGKDDSYLWN